MARSYGWVLPCAFGKLNDGQASEMIYRLKNAALDDCLECDDLGGGCEWNVAEEVRVPVRVVRDV